MVLPEAISQPRTPWRPRGSCGFPLLKQKMKRRMEVLPQQVLPKRRNQRGQLISDM